MTGLLSDEMKLEWNLVAFQKQDGSGHIGVIIDLGYILPQSPSEGPIQIALGRGRLCRSMSIATPSLHGKGSGHSSVRSLWYN